MSQLDSKSSVVADTAQNNSLMVPNGKAAAAAPKLTDDDHVELEDILPSGPELNPDEDIMQLARLGDVPAIERLYESGKFDATYCDAEGITPLHVCAPLRSV
jgi:hypothetical protein